MTYGTYVAHFRYIPSDVRKAVYQRDGGRCVNCGGTGVEYDHVIPVSKGGGNSVNNIQLLCQECIGGKAAR